MSLETIKERVAIYNQNSVAIQNFSKSHLKNLNFALIIIIVISWLWRKFRWWFYKNFSELFGFLSKSWLDIDRDELEVVLVVAVCPWLLLEFACLSEAILGSDAEFEADGWGFSVKNNSWHQNLVKLLLLMKVNKNDGE